MLKSRVADRWTRSGKGLSLQRKEEQANTQELAPEPRDQSAGAKASGVAPKERDARKQAKPQKKDKAGRTSQNRVTNSRSNINSRRSIDCPQVNAQKEHPIRKKWREWRRSGDMTHLFKKQL